MRRLAFHAMGCQMLAVIDSDDAKAANAIEQVPSWFSDWETHLSRFLPDSELTRLNRNPGRSVLVSDTMHQVILESLRAARESRGLVTPTVLEALEVAGYDRSFDAQSLDSRNPAETARVGNWHAIQYDPESKTIQLPRGLRLDFGGVAKGWAAGEAARRLAEYAPALVDAGGDIAVSGRMADGNRWRIGVADPMDPERDLALLMIGEGAVATSGRDYRRWERNGKRQHHIIDPRTGRPAETDVLTATIVAPSATAAEMAAKVTLILGSRTGLEWIEAQSDLAALLVLEGGDVVRSTRLVDYEQSESLIFTAQSSLSNWSWT